MRNGDEFRVEIELVSSNLAGLASSVAVSVLLLVRRYSLAVKKASTADSSGTVPNASVAAEGDVKRCAVFCGSSLPTCEHPSALHREPLCPLSD